MFQELSGNVFVLGPTHESLKWKTTSLLLLFQRSQNNQSMHFQYLHLPYKHGRCPMLHEPMVFLVLLGALYAIGLKFRISTSFTAVELASIDNKTGSVRLKLPKVFGVVRTNLNFSSVIPDPFRVFLKKSSYW